MAKRPALHPAAPLDQALAAIAQELLRDARAAIIGPAIPADEAVHDFRKAIKRWRAFLRLMASHLSADARSLELAARESARKLGRARDLRAMLDAIEDLPGGKSRPDHAVLAGARRHIAALLAEAATAQADMPLREAPGQEVLLWQQQVSHWDFSAIDFDAFSKALAEGYRRARKAAPEQLSTADDEAIHRFRKRVIDHRYQMELIRSLWPRTAKRRIDDAQRLRDELGQHRDLALLRTMTARDKPLHEYADTLLPAIGKRQKIHLSRAGKLASRLFAERPREFRAQIRKLWRTSTN
jgi:CHAD domain-containing protein